MNVGLVGCGQIAEAHLKAWRKVESAKVTAVCDIDEERAREVARRWNVPSRYTDLETMIRRENLTYLSICSPPRNHVDAACSALGAGLNVVVEKPLAVTSKEVDRLIAVSQHSTAKLTVISNFLFKSALTRARRILASMNESPLSVEAHFFKHRDYPPLNDPSHWSHKLPGGIFSELLFHPLYIIRSFLGDLDVAGVCLDRFPSREWMRYERVVAFLGATEKRASIHASFDSPRYATYVDLYGPKNAIRADLGTGDVYLFRDSEKRGASKAWDGIRQATMSLQNMSRLVPDAFSFHLGITDSSHALNIKSFVEGQPSHGSRALTLQDAYKLTQIQEDITTRIDQYER